MIPQVFFFFIDGLSLESFFSVEYIIIVSFNLLFLENLRAAVKIFLLLFLHTRMSPDKGINTANDKNHNNQNSNNKKISILIPAYNEEDCIENSIESAINVTYHNKEIIVIDDNSKDNTFQIAKRFADKGQIKLIKNKDGGSKSKALNLGYMHAIGDIIITLDADTVFINPDSLNDISSKFSDNNDKNNSHTDRDDVSAVCGNLRVLQGDNNTENLLTRLQLCEFLISMEVGRKISSLFNMLLVISGGFGAFRSSVFDRVGKFDHDTMGEDFDLTLKVCKLGTKIPFAENSIVKTSCPNNWKSLIRQRTRWAYAQIQVLLKHRDIVWSSQYRLGLRLAILDMWIMDVIMNFIWITMLAITILSVIISQFYPGFVMFGEQTLSLLPLIFVNYLLLELSLFVFTNITSHNTNPMRLLYLVPVMVLIYRPFMRLVILRAHILAILGRPVGW